MYSELSHEKNGFSIIMVNYLRDLEGITLVGECLCLFFLFLRISVRIRSIMFICDRPYHVSMVFSVSTYVPWHKKKLESESFAYRDIH